MVEKNKTKKSRRALSRASPFHLLCSPLRSLQNAFTVIELIIVVGVLSVLLAIIMPGTTSLRETSKRRRAAAEATVLAQAAIRYKTEYGFWPGEFNPGANLDGTVSLAPVSGGGDFVPLIAYGPSDTIDRLTVTDNNGNDITHLAIKLRDNADADRRRLFQVFSTVGHSSAPPYPSVNFFNPKGIRFLDLKNEGDHEHLDYRDPWGQSYILFMGMNPRSLFRYDVIGLRGTIRQAVSNQTAFAFSLGPLQHYGTNLIYSAGVDPLEGL